MTCDRPHNRRVGDRGDYGKKGRFLNVRFSLGATRIVHRASRHKVYDGTTTSVRHSQLGWLHAASPTFFWRSTLHKGHLGHARSGSSEAVHSSSVSIRTHLPDAHVTRWPSGRARSRPPSAPLIREGRAAERTRIPAIRQRVARSTSDLHGRTRHRVVRAPMQSPRSSGHHSASARDPQHSCGCRKDRAFSIRKRFSVGPPTVS